MPRRLLILVCIALFVVTLRPGSADAFDDGVEFYLNQIKPLLKTKCYSCHGAINQESDLRLDTVRSIRKGGDSGSAIDLNVVADSLLIQRVASDDPDQRMPPDGEPLTAEQIEFLSRWIDEGAISPRNESPQVDPRDHWAFQSLQKTKPPGGKDIHPIDAFIRKRLATAGLSPSPPADPVSLIRRLYFDLHGLPPTPNAIERFKLEFAKNSESATRQLVDRLLESPRYGERWAQHWLDLVRYADTHGYEVNTARPNAWHYRDYVIRALNDDKPYDQFVFEQLAGDSVNQDAATGFLVAAAVLLPGQIGQDEESKRQARQDALDEIVVGTSATFLGLTVGCARCHDHKFDPITQRDYYAMQAYFAGVEYGDRPLSDRDQIDRAAESERLFEKIGELTAQLSPFEQVAFAGRTVMIDDEDETHVSHLAAKNGHGINPSGAGRGYRDDPGDVSRVANLSLGRYTWWPNQPGADVFTWNPKENGRFRLWISWGVHGSGVHTRDARFVLDRDGDLDTRDDQHEIANIDQYYFAGVGEGESAKIPLWSGLFDTGVHEWTETTRLVLRGGETGTGITADVIVLQEVLADEDSHDRLPRIREPVDPAENVERFTSVEAKFVRFTTMATSNNNQYEPCIDELQVFRTGDSQNNIALASLGTRPTSSGNRAETGKHQLKHINDGNFGNSFSWISNEVGRGWVQLEFPKIEKIDRIEWSRDREGNFPDRLPVDYQIDVSVDGLKWTTVAGSDDRAAIGTPFDKVQSLLRNAPDTANIESVVAELIQLKARKNELDKPRLVYAGKMREPDVTHVLLRGDPEQPGDRIGPETPEMFGDENRSFETEQERRIALARWITRSEHPLTARVIANRVWQYHFGRGLVDTPSDFGLSGARPSHPELLDWLANQLIESGWSIKSLHRLILASKSYQQSSVVNDAGQSLDADARLLWRFPSRRLEAEAIRDGMLFVSDQLNLEMGGPGFDFFKTRGGLSGFPPVEDFSRNELRRMIYAHKIRMERVPVFGAFDCPDAGQPTPKRSRSTTAIQALNLFNSPFVAEQADRLADLIKSESGESVDQQVDRLFLRTLGRKPLPAEHAAATRVAKVEGLAVVCRAIFNTNEFLFFP